MAQRCEPKKIESRNFFELQRIVNLSDKVTQLDRSSWVPWAIAELKENFSYAKMWACEHLWPEKLWSAWPLNCVSVMLIDTKPGDVKVSLRICERLLWKQRTLQCKYPSVLHQNWFDHSFLHHHCNHDYHHHHHLVKVGSLTICQKQINLGFTNAMFLVDILSCTKLSYLVWYTTWYFVRQNVHFVIFW